MSELKHIRKMQQVCARDYWKYLHDPGAALGIDDWFLEELLYMQEKLVDIHSVTIGANRVRKQRKPEHIEKLRKSIEEVGLIQPIVLQFNGDMPTIVAGETRLLVIRQLAVEKKPIKFLGREVPLGLVPFVDTTDLTEDELLDIELRENLDREDLTWQEIVEGRRRLYELRTRQGKTISEVAAECEDSNVTRLKEQVNLAARLDDPEIRAASSMKEALKIAAKKDENVFLEALARKVRSRVSGDLRVVEGSAAAFLAESEDASFDMVLTDPPYGINAQNFGVGTMHEYDDSPAAFRTMMEKIMPHLYRVLKASAHMYMFCDIEHFLWLRSLADACGFSAWRTPLIWAKDRGHIPMSTLGPMRCHELILFANKGDKPVIMQNRPDVISAKIVSNKLHAAQKPVELYTELLSRSATLGEHVLDPFCGSGTIFEAAHAARLRATGVDLDVTQATLRVEALLNPPQMELL